MRNATLAAVVTFVGLITLAGMAKNTELPGTTDTQVEDSGIDPGLGTQDASGDVTLGSCHEGQFSRKSVECNVTIHNTSDGTSDYYIEGQARLDGVVIGGLINASVLSVPSGGTAEVELVGVVDGPWDSVRIITAQRTAS
jgi:hypothetical protein